MAEILSKSQLKKQAKLEAMRAKNAEKEKLGLPTGTTAENDLEHRTEFINGMKKISPTLYQTPFPITHQTWIQLVDEHFNKMDLVEMNGKHSLELVTILATVSSVRSAGKVGFITMYYPPEEVMKDDKVKGIIMRPEIQILMRLQNMKMGVLKQTFDYDDAFPGLKIPRYDIVDIEYATDEDRMQATTKYIKEMSRKYLRTFDKYYVIGYPGYSDTGERTIYAKYMFPASLNYHMANTLHGAEEHNVKNFSNPEVMYKTPFLRWLYDTKSLQTQQIRTMFQSKVREILDRMKLTSVDIPHLLSVASGANAKPFRTHQYDGAIDFMLRIAPELELKMLGPIGGVSTHGVYHIGAQFRNEGADATHNPEFTSIEFYAVMMSFRELLKVSESIIKECCIDTLNGTNHVSCDDYIKGAIDSEKINSFVFAKDDKTSYRVELDKPFVNINFIDGINQNLKEGKLPDANTFIKDDSVEIVKKLATDNNVEFKPTDSIAKILDNMFDELVLPNTFSDTLPNSYFKEKDVDGNLIIRPITVYGHPKVMSPLAMEINNDGIGTGIVYRFESFIAGMEICNAYQELSDPTVQRENFDTQNKFQESGDDEAMTQNDTFIRGLEYGMYPVAGWGMGLERMYMLLSNNCYIKDVLPFPQVKS